MQPLALKFRLDDAFETGRPLKDQLTLEQVGDCVGGLVGASGYWASEPAEIEGQVYRSANQEVIVDARIRTIVEFQCVRCLEKGRLTVDHRSDHVLVKGSTKTKAEAITITDDDDQADVETYVGDEVDLMPVLRQDLILSLPMNPSCNDVEANSCSFKPNVHGQEPKIDPRWAPLAELKEKLWPEDGSEQE